MKKFSVFFVMIFCGAGVFSQTLITYGNNTVSKEEFLRAYNKNKPATADREKSMREYLELYTDFKLKVKEGERLRLDTVSQIKYDMQNFRDQITDNYMSNERGIQLLVDEAATRSAKERHVLFFSVPVAPDAAPADTMKAYNAARDLYGMLQKGNADYADVVSNISKLYPAKYADVGFISPFSVAYAFENIIYNTVPGNVSQPYRTAKGWYIFKVTEERPAAGKWKVAQLLFAYPPNADNNTKAAIKAKADSVYELVKKGLLFSDAAKIYSDDRLTYMSGGELQEFSTGKYSSAFENNVYSLRNDNDITRPFETPFGYHIVKRLSRTAIPADKNDATFQFEIKQKLMLDSRINSEKEKFAKEIIAKTGFKRSAAIPDAELYRYADSIMKNPAEENIKKYPISKKTIGGFRDGTQVKGEEWLKYVRNYPTAGEEIKTPNRALSEKFFADASADYYKKHLEAYSNDFKYQMQEFKEGNMLFEIMERNVWSKAGADSVGLLNLYNRNKQSYKWAPSADVLVFNCADEKAATEVKASLETGKKWQAIAEKSNGRILADSGRYELRQMPGSPITETPLPGTFSPVIKNTDGTVVLIKFLTLYGADMQRSFNEARGLVINDYQNVLERQWVNSLRNKYPVKINEAVFKEMVK